ncbi:melatonin receptor type 1B-A-like [Eupeodes corollae]|uniref:melatonin receptor type 1B-A-like n=1 Tax=Eupeodes corollae TaxID=290404 RepID=UPI002491588A|nr:melatonin receptor type 1B-A-like [Eupeodes corollae]
MNTTLFVPKYGHNHTTDDEPIFVQALAAISHHHHHYKRHEFSPVTLSGEWPRMTRLLILSCISLIGSVGNIFMISSIMIEDHLKRAGNAFIGNIALADLLVTSVLMPASTIVLLADIEDTQSVCRVQWFLATCAFLVSILSLAMTAVENYNRLCTPQDVRPWFNRVRTTNSIIFLWLIGVIVSGGQFLFEDSFDFCKKRKNQPLPYQAAVMALIMLVPILVAFYTHMKIIIDAKSFVKSQNFKPSMLYTSDIYLAKTNFYSYIIFVAFWLPFGIVLAYGWVATISNKVFYNTFWIGLSKSCFHNVIYCLTNRHFRNAYVNLFHYCCCKTTVSVARRQRTEGCRPSADVRVHIIPGYNMYSYTSPQRAGNNHHYWNKRDVHEL